MRRGLALAFCAALLFAAPVHSQDSGIAVLKSGDVETYRAIFKAQAAGQIAKADGLVRQLDDKSLLGYVLLERYLGPKYVTKYSELQAWMAKYADHAGADRVHRLALRKKPKAAKAPSGPEPARWRGERFDSEATEAVGVESPRARRLLEQMRDFSRDSQPEKAEALLAPLQPRADLSQQDIDRLGAFVAAAYLAERRDEEALRVAGELILRQASTVPLAHWTAGLACYRLQRF